MYSSGCKFGCTQESSGELKINAAVWEVWGGWADVFISRNSAFIDLGHSLGIRIFEISTDDSNAKPLRQTTVIEKIINPGEKVIANIFLNNLAGETDLRVVRPGQAGVVRESYVGLKTGTEGCMKFE